MGKRLTRDDLKILVKECLLEILSEGLMGESSMNPRKKPSARKPKAKIVNESTIPKRRSSSRRNPIMDRIDTDETRHLLASVTDPVIREALSDSMALAAEQYQNEGLKNVQAADAASMTVAKSDLEDLFGEDAVDSWKNLAF